MITFVEGESKDKLLSFYEGYGFKMFDVRKVDKATEETRELVHLLRLL